MMFSNSFFLVAMVRGSNFAFYYFLWFGGQCALFLSATDEETNGYTLQYSSSGSTDKGNTTDEGI